MVSDIGWRKSSYSGGQGGNCIEVADNDSRVIVRDTKDRQGPALRFSADAWCRLVEQLKRSLAPEGRGKRGAQFWAPLFWPRR
jgi:hypothetical protein